VETEPAFRYAVLRAALDLPPGFMPKGLEGRWYNLDDMLPPPDMEAVIRLGGAIAVATDRFERRYDGATARVYEMRV
jgi:hypothetical protein